MSIISKGLYKAMLGAGSIVERKFIKNTRDAKKVNEEVLLKILKKNYNTEIGRDYNFKNIKSIDDYKRSIPLNNYSFYEKYIDKMMRGDNNILFKEKLEYFGHTSGTTGKQKLIPTNKTNRLVGSKYMALMINRYSYKEFKDRWNYGRGLLIADIVNTTYSEGGTPICSATSGGIQGIKNILKYLYTSPIEVMMVEDKETALYLHLLFALYDSSLLYISGVFISNVLDLFRVFEKNSKALIRDLRRGSISRTLNISDKIRNKLNKMIKPNSTRANLIEEEIKKGYKGIAKRIWPSLTYIATVTGANFTIYDEKVNYYTDNLPIYSPVYAATEATIGINPYVKKVEYVIIPDTCFYEFIPVGDNDNRTYLINELKLNKAYEIVVTNYAGLYRYKLGDVVKVKGYYNDCPSIEFLYRKNQILNMVSEKTNEEHLTNAIKNTMKKMKLTVVDYTTLPDNDVTPGRYVFYFEINEKVNSIKMLEKELDAELRLCNLAYDRARRGKKLSNVKIVLVKNNTFNKIKDELLSNGVSKNQIKIPRVIVNNKKILGTLMKNII